MPRTQSARKLKKTGPKSSGKKSSGKKSSGKKSSQKESSQKESSQKESSQKESSQRKSSRANTTHNFRAEMPFDAESSFRRTSGSSMNLQPMERDSIDGGYLGQVSYDADDYRPMSGIDRREVVELSPCEDDAEMNGLLSVSDVAAMFGHNPDTARIVLKVNGIPDAELNRIAREKGARGIFQRLKRQYESCDVTEVNSKTIKRVFADISEMNVKTIRSAKQMRDARVKASPEARGHFDAYLKQKYNNMPRAKALEETIKTIEAKIEKTRRLKEQAHDSADQDQARLSLLDEKILMETGEVAMAGSYEDFTRIGRVTEILNMLEKARTEKALELLEQQKKTFLETEFLEKDVEKLRKRLENVYGGTTVPTFDLIGKNARGVPMYPIAQGRDMSQIARQMKLMHDTWQNHLQQATECRVVLSRNGIDSTDKWQGLLDKMAKEDPTSDVNLKFSPCLETAMWAYMMQMYEKTGELLDSDGILKGEKYDKFKGSEQIGHSEEFRGTFENSNPHLPKFEEVDDTERLLAEYIEFVTEKHASLSLPEAMKEYNIYSKFGTGFRLGSGNVIMPAPMKEMLTTFMHGDVASKSALLGARGLGGIYDRVQARTGHEKSYDLLSAQARNVLHIRNSIKQRIMLKLSEASDARCPINRFIGSYIDASVAPTAQGDTNLIGTYPFMEEPSMWARLEMGVPSTDTSKRIFKAMSAAFEGMLAADPRGPLAGVASNREAPSTVIATLFDVFDLILATDIDCDTIFNSKMTKEKRQTYVESHMVGDTVNTMAGDVLGRMGCRVSALTFDRALDGPLSQVRDEIRMFAPLPLVDELLLRLGLPSISNNKSSQYGDIDAIAMMQLDIDPEFDKLVKAMQLKLTDAFGDRSFVDFADEKYAAIYGKVMGKIINAALTLRDFKYSYLLSREPTTDEVWELLKEGRYMYKMQTLEQFESKGNQVDIVLTNLGAYRERQTKPDELAASVVAMQEFIKKNVTDKIASIPFGTDTLMDEIFGNKNLIPVTTVGTFMSGYENKKNLLLVLPETLTAAFMDTIASVPKETLAVTITLGNPPITRVSHDIYDKMVEVAMSMMNFDNIFAGGINDPEILRKQVRIIKKQAEALCHLPEHECKSSNRCVYTKASGKGVCIVRGKQEIGEVVDGAGEKVMGQRWIRPGQDLSKTKVVVSAAETGRPYDLVQIGWEDLQGQLLDPTDDAKKLYRALKAVDLLYEYIDTLYIGSVPSRVSGDNKVIMNVFEGLVNATKRQIEFMERLRMDPDTVCRGIHKVLKTINLNVTAIGNLSNEGIEEEENMTDGFMEMLIVLSGLFLSGNGVVFQTPGAADSDNLAIPPPMVYSLLCRLMHAVYMQNNQIRSINCNLNSDECKLNERGGGSCVWKSSTCMNPAIHKLKAFSESGGAFGIVHRVLIPAFAKMLTSAKSIDGYSIDDVPALEKVLVMVFGDEVESLKFMDPFDQIRKLEKLTDYDPKKNEKKYAP